MSQSEAHSLDDSDLSDSPAQNQDEADQSLLNTMFQVFSCNNARNMQLRSNLAKIQRKLIRLLEDGSFQISTSAPDLIISGKFLSPGQHEKMVALRKAQTLAEQRRRAQLAEHLSARQRRIEEQFQMRLQEIRLMQKQERRRKAWLVIAQYSQRQSQRKAFLEHSNQQIRSLKKSPLLHQKLEKQYQSAFVIPVKQTQRIALQPFRQRLKPMNHDSLKQHNRFFMQIKKEVTQSHRKQMQSRLNQPIFKAPYKLKVTQMLEKERERMLQQEEQKRQQPRQKIRKVISYSEMVQKNHMPAISQNSTMKQSSFITKPRVSAKSHYELGNEYLKQVREEFKSKPSRNSLRTKQSSELIPIPQRSRSEVRTKHDYLSKRTDKQLESVKSKKLQNLMHNCEHNKEEIASLVQELQKIDGQLKRKAEFSRIVHGKEDPEMTSRLLENLNLKLQTLQKI